MNIQKGSTVIIEKTNEMEKINSLLGMMIDSRQKEARRQIAYQIQEEIDTLIIRLNPPYRIDSL